MKENGIGCLIFIIVLAIVFGLSMWLVPIILNSDMPVWLKYLILK